MSLIESEMVAILSMQRGISEHNMPWITPWFASKVHMLTKGNERVLVLTELPWLILKYIQNAVILHHLFISGTMYIRLKSRNILWYWSIPHCKHFLWLGIWINAHNVGASLFKSGIHSQQHTTDFIFNHPPVVVMLNKMVNMRKWWLYH